MGHEADTRAHEGDKMKVQKELIHDFLDGSNGRPQRAWLPHWLAFPPAAYTDRGGFRTVRHAEQVAPLFEVEASPMKRRRQPRPHRQKPIPLATKRPSR